MAERAVQETLFAWEEVCKPLKIALPATLQGELGGNLDQFPNCLASRNYRKVTPRGLLRATPARGHHLLLWQYCICLSLIS